MKKLLLPVLLVLCPLLSSRAFAAGESCGLTLENVPPGATIRATVLWKTDDPDEAIEDEGYLFSVDSGGDPIQFTVWRQPWISFTLPPFRASASTVVLSGRLSPDSTNHAEGGEVEGCDIQATINGLAPWVKDYSRNAMGYLGIAGAGLATLSALHPGFKYAAGAAFTMLAVAKKLSDDPVDCTSADEVYPVFSTPPQGPEPDAISILSNQLMRNGAAAYAIAQAAVINANRSACPDFTDAERQALFARAQYQGSTIGNYLARFEKQLNKLVSAGISAGISVDELNDPSFLLEDFWFTFIEFDLRNDPAYNGEMNGLLLAVVTPEDLEGLKNAMFGTPLWIYNCCGPWTQLYPSIWPDGAIFGLPYLTQWSASLIAQEVSQ